MIMPPKQKQATSPADITPSNGGPSTPKKIVTPKASSSKKRPASDSDEETTPSKKKARQGGTRAWTAEEDSIFWTDIVSQYKPNWSFLETELAKLSPENPRNSNMVKMRYRNMIKKQLDELAGGGIVGDDVN